MNAKRKTKPKRSPEDEPTPEQIKKADRIATRIQKKWERDFAELHKQFTREEYDD